MILALKTDSATTTLWLLEAAAKQPDLVWESGRNLSTELLSQVQEVLANRHITFTDLTGIIIFSGPGSFTSLRIGHAVANALADSLGIPIIGGSGEDWLEKGLIGIHETPRLAPALPEYGAEVNITKPKTAPKS